MVTSIIDQKLVCLFRDVKTYYSARCKIDGRQSYVTRDLFDAYANLMLANHAEGLQIIGYSRGSTYRTANIWAKIVDAKQLMKCPMTCATKRLLPGFETDIFIPYSPKTLESLLEKGCSDLK